VAKHCGEFKRRLKGAKNVRRFFCVEAGTEETNSRFAVRAKAKDARNHSVIGAFAQTLPNEFSGQIEDCAVAI
jgi:hypothetical protein